MYIHNVFLANDYKSGRRIVYDLVVRNTDMSTDNERVVDKVVNFQKRIYDALGRDTVVTVHTFVSQYKDWDRIVDKDSFFEDVKLIKEQGRFISCIKISNGLSAFDIRSFLNLVLSKFNRTFDVNTSKLMNKLTREYRDKFKEDLYDKTIHDRRRALTGPKLKEYSDIITDRILSGENGEQKYKFIISSVYSMFEK